MDNNNNQLITLHVRGNKTTNNKPKRHQPPNVLLCCVPDTDAFPGHACHDVALFTDERTNTDRFVKMQNQHAHWEGQIVGKELHHVPPQRFLIFALDQETGEATLVNTDPRAQLPIELHPRIDVFEPPPRISNAPSILVETFGSKKKKKDVKMKEQTSMSNSLVSKKDFIKTEMDKAFAQAEATTSGDMDDDLLVPRRNLEAKIAADVYIKDDYFPESHHFDQHFVEQEYVHNEDVANSRNGKYFGDFVMAHLDLSTSSTDDNGTKKKHSKTTMARAQDEHRRLASYCAILIRFFRDFPDRASLVDTIRYVAGKDNLAAIGGSGGSGDSSNQYIDAAYRDTYKEICKSLLARFTTQQGDKWKRFKSARERLMFVILVVALELTGTWCLSSTDLDLLQADLGLSKSLSPYLYRLGTRPKTDGKVKMWMLKPENLVTSTLPSSSTDKHVKRAKVSN